jgi:hypothetical protein
VSQIKDEEKTKKRSSQWAEIMAQFFELLIGKGTEISYDFQDLVIDIPKAVGLEGQDLGSAKSTINGRIIITAEAHEDNN